MWLSDQPFDFPQPSCRCEGRRQSLGLMGSGVEAVGLQPQKAQGSWLGPPTDMCAKLSLKVAAVQSLRAARRVHRLAFCVRTGTGMVLTLLHRYWRARMLVYDN